MLDGLRQLIDLQKLDDELNAAEGEKAAIPGRRADLAAQLERAEQAQADARAALQEAEGGQRKAEAELQDKEALVQKLEGQQFQVKTNEAYTTLLRELDQARDAISACETRILEAMETIETAGAASQAAEEAARETQQRASQAGSALDSREQELGERVASLREGRTRVCAEIDSALLAQYQRIASRQRPAVARVRQEICQGCRVGLPPQLRIELLRGEKLITCTHCRRILVPDSLATAANSAGETAV